MVALRDGAGEPLLGRAVDGGSIPKRSARLITARLTRLASGMTYAPSQWRRSSHVGAGRAHDRIWSDRVTGRPARRAMHWWLRDIAWCWQAGVPMTTSRAWVLIRRGSRARPGGRLGSRGWPDLAAPDVCGRGEPSVTRRRARRLNIGRLHGAARRRRPPDHGGCSLAG